MRISDIFRSIGHGGSEDASDSFFDHVVTLGNLSFREFLRQGRGMPRGFIEEAGIRFTPRMLGVKNGGGGFVCILPVGDVPSKVIGLACRVAWDVFGIPVRVLRRREIWPEAYDHRNFQVDADRVIALASPKDDCRVLVLTNLELFSHSLNSPVWGYGMVYGKPVCAVSTHGLGPFEDKHLPWSRVTKVVVHEIGHTYGLRHHVLEEKDVPCVMNMVPAADGQIGLDFLHHEFCSRCLGDLLAGRVQQPREEKPCGLEKL